MFYYIYKFKDKGEGIKELLEIIPSESPGFKFKNYLLDNPKTIHGIMDELDASVLFEENGVEDEVQIKFRPNSGFAFIQTDLQGKKNKVVKFLNSYFDNKLENFVPLDIKEKELIYNESILNHAKFFLGDEIVTDVEIEDASCMDETDEDCTLFEASIELKVDDHNVPLYYYGDAIQFPENVNENEVELAIKKFEKIMAES